MSGQRKGGRKEESSGAAGGLKTARTWQERASERAERRHRENTQKYRRVHL